MHFEIIINRDSQISVERGSIQVANRPQKTGNVSNSEKGSRVNESKSNQENHCEKTIKQTLK